jgi:hypothetical protein
MDGVTDWPARARRVLALTLVAAAAAGCGTLPRNPVPPELASIAAIPGMPDVRAWAGRPDAAMERDIEASFAEESERDFPSGPGGVVTYPHLALSGGGANGAFGAGFLNGWSAAGTRPTFKIVTGVSTGALMAPFAFLGPEYDDELREFYTTTRTRDIFLAGSALDVFTRLLTADSLADTGPLAALIARHVDERLLERVADAHRSGRRLYVGSADLDAQRFVVWNLGRIAASGHPDSLALFRKAMLASASIPIAFPPVLFEVEAGGARYDELHVDGAVAAHVFLNGGVFRPEILRTRAGRGGSGRESIYVIHNGQLVALPSPTPRSIPGIAGRVIEASGRASVIGDLFRIYALSLREQGEFRWITIPEEATLRGAEIFDPEKMAELYELGYAAAKAGPAWFTRPPGVENRGVPLGDSP